MTPVLQTENLTKRFGRLVAVDGLNLEVYRGQVFGILGPNGSGKTTTLAMLLGVVKRTDGTYIWFGEGDHYELRKRIGAILEYPIFYPFLSAVDNLRITAHIKDVSRYDEEALMRLVGLYERRKDAYKTYSLGMKQRLAIATAMVGDPEVLILDEPTNGLDPQGIAEVRRLILEISAMGKTIILASHLLDEVQKVCTHFCVLQRGSKVYQGGVADTLNQKHRIEVYADDPETLHTVLKEYRAVKTMERKNGVIIIQGEELSTKALNQYLIEKGIIASHLARVHTNLEEQFLEILKENDR
ncbi:MAG TPA: ATP-binding cassette domain-containing protein [Saprospiraceae bacterium]|nr:ATP-binding cassette domain-containing protein [Saprospiraceae bacterium]